MANLRASSDLPVLMSGPNECGIHLECTTGGTPIPDTNSTEFEQLLSVQARDIAILICYCILGTPINFLGCLCNITNIIVFFKMGFAETINISLVALAVSDLLGLITLQWVNVCMNPLVLEADLPFDPFEVQYLTAGHPHIVFTRITSFITVYIAFERCLCVALPLKVKAICTPTTTVVVLVIIVLTMAAPVVPIYLVNGLGWKIYEARNRSLVGLVFGENRFAVEQVTFAINNANNFIAFALVVVFTAVLINKLKSKSRWRGEALVGDAKKVAASGNKERRVIVMVTMITSVFIVCSLPMTIVTLFSMTLEGFSVVGKHSNLAHCLTAIWFLVEEINAGVNMFIYLKMSAKFRSTFHSLFKGERNKT